MTAASWEFASENLAEVEEFFCRAYSRIRLATPVPGRPAPMKVRRTQVGAIILDHLLAGFDMHYDVHPLGRISLLQVHDGRFLEHRSGDNVGSYGPGDVFVPAEPDAPYRGQLRQADYSLMLLEPGLLDRYAAPPGTNPGPVRLTGHRPHSRAAEQCLRATMAMLRDTLTGPAGVVELDDLAVEAAEQLVAGAVLATLPNNASVDPEPADRHDAHSGVLRRAVAYIESNAARPVTVRDVADAARVSVRALQLAFRRDLGCTPMEYLRRVRLQAAHLDLLAADPDHTTVAAVIRRWGFTNPGRFTSLHRTTYGTTPAQALRK